MPGCSVCVCGHWCLRVFMRWVHAWMFRMCRRVLVPACVHEVGTCLDVPYVYAACVPACVHEVGTYLDVPYVYAGMRSCVC